MTRCSMDVPGPFSLSAPISPRVEEGSSLGFASVGPILAQPEDQSLTNRNSSSGSKGRK